MQAHSFVSRCTALLLLLLSGLTIMEAAALTPIVPGHALKRAGFATDPASLLQYLSEGLPHEAQPEQGYHAYQRKDLPHQRWKLYIDAAHLLQEVPVEKAVPLPVPRAGESWEEVSARLQPIETPPVLRARLLEPLPEPLLQDLLMHLALQSYDEPAWEAWDRRRADEESSLRFHCGMALLQVDSQGGRAPVLAFLLRERPDLEAAASENIDPMRVQRFAQLAAAAALAGEQEAVDQVFALLPNVRSSYQRVLITLALQPLSEAPPRLYRDSSEHEIAAAWRQWQAWWAQNHAAFTPPAEPIHYRPPQPRLETLEDYLLAAGQARIGGAPTPPGWEETNAWLERYAARHQHRLRRIAEDPEARRELRDSALQWYLKVRGTAALRWVRAQLLRENAATPSPENSNHYGALFRWLGEHHPETAQEIAVQSVQRNLPSARMAAQVLLRTPEGRAVVAAHHKQLVAQFPEQRGSWIQSFGRDVSADTVHIFEDALIHGDRFAAAFAVIGLREPGVTELLSPAAREALANWETDPLFLLRVLQYDQQRSVNPEEVAEILQMAPPPGAEAAHVYARAYRLLAREEQDTIGSVAEACLDMVRKCISLYRESRGL